MSQELIELDREDVCWIEIASYLVATLFSLGWLIGWFWNGSIPRLMLIICEWFSRKCPNQKKKGNKIKYSLYLFLSLFSGESQKKQLNLRRFSKNKAVRCFWEFRLSKLALLRLSVQAYYWRHTRSDKNSSPKYQSNNPTGARPLLIALVNHPPAINPVKSN